MRPYQYMGFLHVFYLLDVKGELQNFDTDKQKRDIYDILLRIYGMLKKIKQRSKTTIIL